MPDLVVWKNEQIKQLKRDMERLFTDLYRDLGTPLLTEVLGDETAVDVTETADRIIAVVELPGVAAKDLDINVSEQMLVLSGARQEKISGPGGTLQRTSRFTNRLRLPCRIKPEEVEASFAEGRLQVSMPKCRHMGFHKVQVKGAGE